MKQKTRKSAVARFSVTGTGKIMHRGKGIRHLRSNKSNRRIRAQSIPHEVLGTVKAKVRKMLGI